jgi:hypothetical protein
MRAELVLLAYGAVRGLLSLYSSADRLTRCEYIDDAAWSL